MTKNIKELEQEEEALSRAVRSSAQQIWQAGLGAFAKAQEEGGRVFSKLVDLFDIIYFNNDSALFIHQVYCF